MLSAHRIASRASQNADEIFRGALVTAVVVMPQKRPHCAGKPGTRRSFTYIERVRRQYVITLVHSDGVAIGCCQSHFGMCSLQHLPTGCSSHELATHHLLG